MFNQHLKKINRISNYNFDRSKYLCLDKNERIVPFRNKILSDLKKNISNNIIQSYPGSCEKLKKLISKKEKINKSFINVVPGTDSAIKYLFEIFSGKKKKTIVSIYPTYGMIDIYSKIYKYKLVKVNLNNKIDINKFIQKKTSFIYIANPNQPSGRYINLADILLIIKKAQKNGTYVVIDEAYIDFSDFKSISTMVKKYKNLIVLKSLSKSFGIAGLRIGYMIANPNINKILNTVRPSYDISFLSIKAGEYFLKNFKIAENFIKQIKDTKKFFINECFKRNLKFENTQTNFVYIKLPAKKVKKVHNFLFKNKILVRSNYLGNYKNFSNSIRITVGNKDQMKKFFTYFDKICKVKRDKIL